MNDLAPMTLEQLESGLDVIRHSPAQSGTLELIVCRPSIGERAVLTAAELDLVEGLIGDSWRARGNPFNGDAFGHPEMQLNVMNARAIALIAQHKERWALAGDQLYLDFDIGEANLPVGSRVQCGTAVIEVTPVPHTGCKKFLSRFGVDAVKFVNSPEGRALRLRGLNAKVVQRGVIRVGDPVTKL